MVARREVVLLIETSNSYARGLLRGIHAYAREHGRWSLVLPEQGRGDAPPAWLKHWRGDGILARIENRRIAEVVRRTKLPVVDLSAARMLPDVPFVETDDEAIARQAVEHLRERGFRQFAYCGDPQFTWSRQRAAAMRRLLEAAGDVLHEFPAGSARGPLTEEARLAAWIERLPKPIGVLACYDRRGHQLLETCRRLDVAVPEQVAVLGVDNDELLCSLALPPLSSIAPDTRRTGYWAAELLERQMSGKRVQRTAHLVVPTGIACRQSTDVLAMDDAEVARAVRLIRERACQGIDVGDVVAGSSLSRRVLESRFKKSLGRTPHEEIQRVRLRRVEQLLRETDLPLATIADRAGYRHSEYLSVVFKQVYGVPPSVFRAQPTTDASVG